jgi:hypothetical protein
MLSGPASSPSESAARAWAHPHARTLQRIRLGGDTTKEKKRWRSGGTYLMGLATDCAIRGTNDRGGRIVPSHLFVRNRNYNRGTFGDCSTQLTS